MNRPSPRAGRQAARTKAIMQITFWTHAIRRMFGREYTVAEVRQVIEADEMIEVYPEDTPYPSCLLLGWVADRPTHVVVAKAETHHAVFVITVYEPDPTQWSADFRKRLL